MKEALLWKAADEGRVRCSLCQHRCLIDEGKRGICGARLDPVLNTIRLCHTLGIWIEVTTLIIPGWNDSARELREIADFIADVGWEVPWHVTGFIPAYTLTKALPTPARTLEMAQNIGREAGLKHVYIGNMPEATPRSATLCPSCERVAIGGPGRPRTGNLPTESARIAERRSRESGNNPKEHSMKAPTSRPLSLRSCSQCGIRWACRDSFLSDPHIRL